MLHAKFQNQRTSGFEEVSFKVFNIYGPRPSLSCDLDHLHKLSFTLWRLHKKLGFDWSSGFREKGI